MASAVAGDPCSGVIGQARACGILQAFSRTSELPSLLLVGDPGVGKRTVALRLAQALNCNSTDAPCGRCQSCGTLARLNHPDIKMLFPIKLPKEIAQASDDQRKAELAAEETVGRYGEYGLDACQPVADPRKTISIYQVRWLRREMARAPLMASRRFFLILHAHRMTEEAANALLKMLEEPQKQTTFILTTDSPDRLPDTIRSRCRAVRFGSVPAQELARWLEATRGVAPEAAQLAAEMSRGSVGAALRFLECPDDFLAPPVLEFFAGGAVGEPEVLETMFELGHTALDTVVGTLLFLYSQTTRVKLGLPSAYALRAPAIERMAASCSSDYLHRVTRYLSGRLSDSRLYLNRNLFLYTLLSSVRRPA